MQEQWWHGKVAYQIYPKSFKDSNNGAVRTDRHLIWPISYAILGRKEI